MRFHIEKNTVEIRQKLEKMGFEKNPFMSPEEYIDENMFLVVCSENGYNTIVTAHPHSKIILPKYSKRKWRIFGNTLFTSWKRKNLCPNKLLL